MSSSDDYATRPEPRQQVAACDRVLAARPADRDLMIARAQGLSRGKRHDEAVAQAERAMSDQYGRTNLLQWLQYQDILVEARVVLADDSGQRKAGAVQLRAGEPSSHKTRAVAQSPDVLRILRV